MIGCDDPKCPYCPGLDAKLCHVIERLVFKVAGMAESFEKMRAAAAETGEQFEMLKQAFDELDAFVHGKINDMEEGLR